MKHLIRSLGFLLVIAFLFPRSSTGIGEDNSTGVTGQFNGNITTGGSYDPYTGNATRVVDDVIVPGSVGAYPLKWTRVINTRTPSGWTGSYGWAMTVRHSSDPSHWNELDPPYTGPDAVVRYPDGRFVEFYGEPGSWYGAFDSVDTNARLVDRNYQNYDLILSDGGTVTFRATPTVIIDGVQHYTTPKATSIIDPYGQITTLERDTENRLWKITEPGGRYLEVTYTAIWVQGSTYATVIDYVRANDGRGNYTQMVDYDYDRIVFHDIPSLYLARVNYNNDQSQATYTYRPSNATNVYHGAVLHGMIETCRDVRYDGAMKNIKYEYMSQAGRLDVGFGQIKAERNATTGQLVSEVIYPSPPPQTPEVYNRRTEQRGDHPNAKRVFQYSYDAGIPETSTDFESVNHVTSTSYFFPPGLRSYKVVTDPRLNQTTIERQMVPVIAVMSVKHNNDPAVVFEYTDNNYPYYLARRTDENGKITEYTRDIKNRIERIDYPDGGFEIFTYDSSNPYGQVLTHRLTSGGTEHFRYDSRGLKTQSWPAATLPSDPNPENHPTQYFYYGPGNGRPDRIDRLWYVIDPRGYMTSFDYDEQGHVTRVTHHDDGSFAQSKYNSDGTLEWTEDELAHRTSYQYDEYERVTKVTNHLQEYTTYSYDPDPGEIDLSLTHTTSSVYRTTSFMGRKTDCKYDRNFRKVEETQAAESADAALRKFTYDPVGNLKAVEDPRGKITNYDYDHRNRQSWVRKDELNQTTEFQYDFVGNKTRETRPDGVFRAWDYDEMNRIWHAYDWRTNEVARPDQTTTYDRDDAGNPLSIKDAKGALYKYEYDELNRKKKATYPIDATGQERKETWLYDIAGNLKIYKNPAGQFKHFEYDARNRQRRVYWNAFESSETPNWNVGAETTTTLDYAGRVKEVRTNGGETIVGFEYDHANRKLWEDQTLAGQPTRRVKTDLDGDGKRQNLQIVAPSQEGGGGIVGAIVSPEMTGTGLYSIAYEYTYRNQLKKITGEDWEFEYFYDPSGNMTKRQASYNGRSSATHCPTESYDALNRPANWKQTGPNGFYALSHHQYDRANREKATWRTEENNQGELFQYEVTNQLSRVVYNVAISPTPSPSATPPNATPTPPGQQVAEPSFDPDGGFWATAQPITVTLTTSTTGASMRYTFGDTPPTANQGTAINSGESVSVFPTQEGITLNAIAFKPGSSDSVVHSATYVCGGTNPGAGPRIVTYNYTPDKLNRSGVNDTAAEQTRSYTPNGLNQYSSVGGISYTYDNKFNLTGAGGFGGVYDAANRLVSAWNSALAVQAEVELVYDGLGRCVKRTVAGVVTVFIYDGWKPIAEWDGWTEEYFQSWNVYGPGADEILLRHSARYGYTRYHSDLHGNVKFLLDNDGQLQEKYTYDVFGRPKITDAYGNPRSSSWWDNRFLFQGREYIAELGVYDYRNRFYHPDLGRFLQTDPTGFDAGDMNLFRYCNDDPIIGSDPTGLYDVGFEGFGTPFGRHGPTRNTVGNAALNRYLKSVGGPPAFHRTQKGQQKAIAAIKQVLAKNPKEPINIIGYSRGAEAAVEVAKALRKEKITVTRLNLVDPVGRFSFPQRLTVPDNVQRAVNYYQTNGGPFSGGPIKNPGPNYQNVDMTKYGVDHDSIVERAFPEQRTTQPSSEPAVDPPSESDFLDFMLDGGSGGAGVSGAPPPIRPR